jgi:hypothetical protein
MLKKREYATDDERQRKLRIKYRFIMFKRMFVGKNIIPFLISDGVVAIVCPLSPRKMW